MKVFAFAFITLIGMTACASPDKVKDTAPKPEHEGAHHHKHHKHAERGKKHHKHAGHGHRFEDPSKYAKSWNDPARDAWQKPEELILLMEIQPGMTVADLGAGTGYMLPHLSKATGEQGAVIALDVEDAMITYLQKNLASYGSNVRVVKAPFDAPGVEAGSLDRLVTINTWHHIENREAYAAKVLEALKPGGRFVVVEFTMDSPVGAPKKMRIDEATVLKELKAGGFDASVATETMPNHHVVIGVKR